MEFESRDGTFKAYNILKCCVCDEDYIVEEKQ